MAADLFGGFMIDPVGIVWKEHQLTLLAQLHRLMSEASSQESVSLPPQEHCWNLDPAPGSGRLPHVGPIPRQHAGNGSGLVPRLTQARECFGRESPPEAGESHAAGEQRKVT